jgi:hypothetical protein
VSTEADRRRYAQQIADNWADKGMILEGGWRAGAYLIFRDITAEQEVQLRKAFFLGAEHLFSTIMMVLDPGSEPTERDLQRMSLIHKELEAFKLALASVHKPAERQQ